VPTRDIYLKIEAIPDYSHVSPDSHVSPPVAYERDCMRTAGHENGTIPPDEVNARRLTALVYREYLDSSYLVPKPDKLVAADVNEPAYNRRVPGTVIYARPGDWLRIHVKNADLMPHSLHVHVLRYGIDSDGSWPLGTQSDDGRRSDEICPGQTWTYKYEVTDKMVGAWPFHDHYRDIGMSVNRGLFGGIVILPKHEHEQLPHFSLPPNFRQRIEELIREHAHRPPEPGPDPGPLELRGHMGPQAGAVAMRGMPGACPG
jgi:FtsP/CotA-like multicopper oxidase with cupredoxin domain